MGTTWFIDPAVRPDPRTFHKATTVVAPPGQGVIECDGPDERESHLMLRKKKSLIDQAGEYVDAVRPQIESAVATAKDTAKNKALPLLADARDKAVPVLVDAVDRAGAQLVEAREKAGPMLADARDKAGPALADARDKAAPVIADARAKAAPIVAAGVALAGEKAVAGRELATAKAAQLTGRPAPQPKKKRGGRVTKLLLVTGLAALAAFVVRKVQGRGAKDNWQSSYVPSPPPSPATQTPPVATTPVGGDTPTDTGGSSPDEALADLAEEPHDVTDPDAPLEVVEVDDPATDRP
jgi:ElaB/YqjD/DUF883 family membrane-anchored ribosome-binding protein